MKKFINFCKNNILEILFLFGVIGIYAGYCLYLTEFPATWLNLLFSFCTFIVEFVWLMFLSYFAKTSRTLVKLLFLNLLAIISLVIICSIPSSQLPLMILIGILSFLFSWTIFVAIMQTKNLTFKDNKDIGNASNKQKIGITVTEARQLLRITLVGNFIDVNKLNNINDEKLLKTNIYTEFDFTSLDIIEMLAELSVQYSIDVNTNALLKSNFGKNPTIENFINMVNTYGKKISINNEYNSKLICS